jgi:hypothetical protein
LMRLILGAASFPVIWSTSYGRPRLVILPVQRRP